MQGDGSGLRRRFREIITSEEQLRSVLGQPSARASAKIMRVIDDYARRFIAHAPFVFVASASADGVLDVSPKGDPAGFVKVLDEKTIAIPDRPGNRRIDTFRNRWPSMASCPTMSWWSRSRRFYRTARNA